jgi:predicted Fe-S protein YdhL (DUF1289 family)
MSDSDTVWRRDEIESPCVKICVLHPETDTCVGCRRTRAEIGAWSRLDPSERRRIMEELPDRPEPARRRGGARARRTGGE